jgi:monoamine oxidase
MLSALAFTLASVVFVTPPPDPTPTATPTPPPAPTPGGKPWTASEIAQLRKSVAKIFKDPTLRGAQIGLLAVDTVRGNTLFSQNADHLHLQSIVEEIAWEPGRVVIRSRRYGEVAQYEARKAIVTLPVGVLRSGAVRFTPKLPQEKQDAISRIAMGPVLKVALRFGEPFWAQLRGGALQDAAFFFAGTEPFPTYWTTYPAVSPLIMAWAGGPKAAHLSGCSEEQVIARALAGFAHALDLDVEDVRARLESAYVHDWQRDPYARGAYSYVLVGGLGARAALAAPVDKTLYFAGEATAPQEEAGTVAGALMSGITAAARAVPRSAQTRGADAESR